MKILAQCGIIFAICVAGIVVSAVTRLPVPGNVWGIIILFLLLYFKVITKQQIRRVSRFLIGNMAFFFLPSGVAILAHFNSIRHVLIPYLLIIVFTTVIVLSVTGTFSQWMQRLLVRKHTEPGGGGGAMKLPPVSKPKMDGPSKLMTPGLASAEAPGVENVGEGESV